MPIDIFDGPKVVIAMAHIGALPGTPLYDPDGGMNRLIDGVARDIEKLQAGGVHAIMFGNENDRPYRFRAPLESATAMTAIVSALKPELTVPFGVNFFTEYKIPTTWWSAVIALMTSVVVGVIFGTLPANRAASLDPVETLKYE